MTLLILFLMLSGLAVFSAIMAARWIDGLLWRRQLVAYRLELPRGLTHGQVSGWLAALGAITRHIPVVIEVNADSDGITHVIAVPRFHVRAVLNQARSMLAGLRSEPVLGYVVDSSTVRAAGELRVTSPSHPLAQDRASYMASAFLAALQPLAPGTQIRVSWLIAGVKTPHGPGVFRACPGLSGGRGL